MTFAAASKLMSFLTFSCRFSLGEEVVLALRAASWRLVQGSRDRDVDSDADADADACGDQDRTKSAPSGDRFSWLVSCCQVAWLHGCRLAHLLDQLVDR